MSKITEGKGPLAPVGELIEIHYTGTLLNGEKFDSSWDYGSPLRFYLGHEEVIECWDKGIAQLTKGQKAILNCPPEMAYGDEPMEGIPAGATLRFEVEVMDFVIRENKL